MYANKYKATNTRAVFSICHLTIYLQAFFLSMTTLLNSIPCKCRVSIWLAGGVVGLFKKFCGSTTSTVIDGMQEILPHILINRISSWHKFIFVWHVQRRGNRVLWVSVRFLPILTFKLTWYTYYSTQTLLEGINVNHLVMQILWPNRDIVFHKRIVDKCRFQGNIM